MSATLTPVGSYHATDVCHVVEHLVRMLVGSPDEVRVEASADMGAIVLRVIVSGAHIGKVIGRDGRTVRALRTILAAMGHANGHRFVLDIEACPEYSPRLQRVSEMA